MTCAGCSYTGYDDLGQLTSESRTGYSASYTYDANGNRATKTLGGVTETYSYDDGDKLTSVTWSGGSETYGYDAAGKELGEEPRQLTSSRGINDLRVSRAG